MRNFFQIVIRISIIAFFMGLCAVKANAGNPKDSNLVSSQYSACSVVSPVICSSLYDFTNNDLHQIYCQIVANGGNRYSPSSLCTPYYGDMVNLDLWQILCAIRADSGSGGNVSGHLKTPCFVYDSLPNNTLGSAFNFTYSSGNMNVLTGAKIIGNTNANYIDINQGQIFDASATQAISWGTGVGHNQRILYDENGTNVLQWNANNVHIMCSGNNGSGLSIIDRATTEQIVFIGDNFADGGQMVIRDQLNNIKINLTPIPSQPAYINNTFLIGKTTDDFSGILLQIHGKGEIDNKLKIADGSQALNYIYTSDASGTGTWQLNNAGQITAHYDSVGATTAIASLVNYTTSGLHTYRVGGYIKLRAVTTDIIEVQVTYTDEQGISQTSTFAANNLANTYSTIGVYQLLDMNIRAFDGTNITIKTNFTVSGGSITYDAGGNITLLY